MLIANTDGQTKTLKHGAHLKGGLSWFGKRLSGSVCLIRVRHARNLFVWPTATQMRCVHLSQAFQTSIPTARASPPPSYSISWRISLRDLTASQAPYWNFAHREQVSCRSPNRWETSCGISVVVLLAER